MTGPSAVEVVADGDGVLGRRCDDVATTALIGRESARIATMTKRGRGRIRVGGDEVRRLGAWREPTTCTSSTESVAINLTVENRIDTTARLTRGFVARRKKRGHKPGGVAPGQPSKSLK